MWSFCLTSVFLIFSRFSVICFKIFILLCSDVNILILYDNKIGLQTKTWNITSFPVIHKVGNVDIFVLPEFEKYDR